MAQQLRALVALPEDLDSIPSTHMAAHNSVAPEPGDLTPSHRHTHKQNTNAIKNKSLKKKKNSCIPPFQVTASCLVTVSAFCVQSFNIPDWKPFAPGKGPAKD